MDNKWLFSVQKYVEDNSADQMFKGKTGLVEGSKTWEATDALGHIW